ncbi:ABC transporter permease [Antribacter gilvus]|uniref:ABC transporter permease n=1 Tax=Antribacter gilvus TaxID=2304675 RepID=UPI000F7B9581|nr:FtsX-like permease family protein [Antribacter gilvus]
MIARIALRDLTHHWREAVGVVTMVALGLSLFVVAMSFVATIAQNADRLLFGTIGAPWLLEPATRDDALRLGEADAAGLGERVGAASVRMRLEVPATLVPAGGTHDPARPGSATATIVGVDLADEAVLARSFDVTQTDLGPGNVVVHREVAAQLGLAEGDEVELRAGSFAGVLTVSRVVVPENPSFVLATWVLVDRASLAEDVFGDAERVNQVLVDAPETDAVGAALEDAAADLSTDGATATVSPWTATPWSALELGPRIWGILLVSAFTFMFLVVCLGLTSLVYAALLARLRDVAILRVTGMSPARVRRTFLFEVVLQYGVGFTLAAGIATVAILVVNAVGVTSTADAFTFAVGATTLRLMPAWWAYLVPFGIGLVLSVAVLWAPIRSISNRPVLELLELSA